MGWAITLALALLSWLALYLSRRCSRQALELAAAAILIALAGYAWQGHPDTPGRPMTSTAAQ